MWTKHYQLNELTGKKRSSLSLLAGGGGAQHFTNAQEIDIKRSKQICRGYFPPSTPPPPPPDLNKNAMPFILSFLLWWCRPKSWMDALERPQLDYTDFFTSECGQEAGNIIWQIENFIPIQVEEGQTYALFILFLNNNNNNDNRYLCSACCRSL